MTGPSTNNDGLIGEKDEATPTFDGNAANEEEGEGSEENEESESEEDADQDTEEFSDEEAEDFSDGLDSDFGDDGSLDHGLEPTDFSESLHVSDLISDENLPEQTPKDVSPGRDGETGTEKKDRMNTTALLVAGGAGLAGIAGVALLATKLNKKLRDESDDVDEDDAAAVIQQQQSAPQQMGESTGQSSSGNMTGSVPV
eukprot:scaffold3736_cov176-Amphora_coffeaeformis.AAC.2